MLDQPPATRLRCEDPGSGAAAPVAAPALSPVEFFCGRVTGAGIVEDRFGRLRRRFSVAMRGAWQGAELVLDEDFIFTDGVREHRRWRIRGSGARRYTAAADDLVGIARGEASPTTLRWRYRMRVPIGRRRIVFAFDDRMHLAPDGTLLDVSEMRKFGVVVARLTLALRRA